MYNSKSENFELTKDNNYIFKCSEKISNKEKEDFILRKSESEHLVLDKEKNESKINSELNFDYNNIKKSMDDDFLKIKKLKETENDKKSTFKQVMNDLENITKS